MCPDPVATIGRLRILSSVEPASAWRVSTFADSVIRSLRLAFGHRRVSLTLARRS